MVSLCSFFLCWFFLVWCGSASGQPSELMEHFVKTLYFAVESKSGDPLVGWTPFNNTIPTTLMLPKSSMWFRTRCSLAPYSAGVETLLPLASKRSHFLLLVHFQPVEHSTCYGISTYSSSTPFLIKSTLVSFDVLLYIKNTTTLTITTVLCLESPSMFYGPVVLSQNNKKTESSHTGITDDTDTLSPKQDREKSFFRQYWLIILGIVIFASCLPTQETDSTESPTVR